MPSASNEETIVLAVYIPPQAPTRRAGVLLDADEVLFAHLAGGEGAHRLERRLTIVRSCPFHLPGLMVPP